DSIIGVKYMFYEDEKTDLQLAIYPQLTFIDPAAEAIRKGVATRGSILTLPFLLARKVGETSAGDVNMTVNLGYNISSQDDVANSISSAVGVGAAVSNKVALLSEVTTEQAIVKDADGIRQQAIKGNLGVIGTVNKNLLLLASVGHSIYSSDGQDHTYVLAGF